MNTLAFTMLAILTISVHGALVDKMPVTGRLSGAAQAALRRRIAAAGGCNANVCFAIDGSGSINSTEFENQKNLVLDVTSVIGVDDPVEFAAVQYGTSNSAISRLTADKDRFNLEVNRARQMGGASFVSAGISYCFSQLRRRSGEANKIVLLGDGRGNIGASAVRGPTCSATESEVRFVPLGLALQVMKSCELLLAETLRVYSKWTASLMFLTLNSLLRTLSWAFALISGELFFLTPSYAYRGKVSIFTV